MDGFSFASRLAIAPLGLGTSSLVFLLKNISSAVRILPVRTNKIARRSTSGSFICGAPGRIRTSVATRALDLQSSTFDHSVTDAYFILFTPPRRGKLRHRRMNSIRVQCFASKGKKILKKKTPRSSQKTRVAGRIATKKI